MAETFSFELGLATAGGPKYRTLRLDYGDGYSQSMGVGINNRAESWSITATGRWGRDGMPVKAIAEFLDRHAGFKSFIWTPPNGQPGRYVCREGYQLSPQGAGIHTLTAMFEQVFYP